MKRIRNKQDVQAVIEDCGDKIRQLQAMAMVGNIDRSLLPALNNAMKDLTVLYNAALESSKKP